MIAVDGDAGDQNVAVAAGDEVVVTLAENPTTGHRWTVESVSGEIALVSSDFEAATGARAGAAGRRTIRLRAGGHGQGEVRLRSGRSWEANAGDSRQCRLVFTVG